MDMLSKWDHPPPLCVLSGTEKFLIRSELEEALSRAHVTNRRIERISTKNELDRIFQESVWNDQKVLVIIEGSEYNDKLLIKHHESQDNQVSVIIIPNKGKARIAKHLPKSLVAKFESPKPWERETWVTSWVIKEAKKRSMSLAEPLAKILVKALGNQDLGILYWQIWKLEKYLGNQDRRIVSMEDIQNVLIHFSSVQAQKLVEIIGYKKKNEVSFILSRVKGNGSNIFMVLAFLAKSLRQWIMVKSMSEISPEEIGQRLGLSPYVVKKNILTVTARWNLKDLSSLFRGVVEVRQAAKWGSHDPWLHLESVLCLYI